MNVRDMITVAFIALLFGVMVTMMYGLVADHSDYVIGALVTGFFGGGLLIAANHDLP